MTPTPTVVNLDRYGSELLARKAIRPRGTLRGPRHLAVPQPRGRHLQVPGPAAHTNTNVLRDDLSAEAATGPGTLFMSIVPSSYGIRGTLGEPTNPIGDTQ